MKKILLISVLLFITVKINSQKIINLDKTNGVYYVPCKVNGVPMRFIFDTGASNVSISMTEAKFLIKQGLLAKKDIKESVKYKIANGEIKKGTEINIREIEIYGLKINDVTATIVHEQDAPLLLGISALRKLGKIELQNDKLLIYNNQFKPTEKVNLDEEIEKTISWINHKFVKYSYSDKNVRQHNQIDKIDYTDNKPSIIGIAEEETTYLGLNKNTFVIPVNNINNIEYAQKGKTYWITVKIIKNEEKVLLYKNKKNFYYVNSHNFILSKDIETAGLIPEMKRAFDYLIELSKKKTSK